MLALPVFFLKCYHFNMHLTTPLMAQLVRYLPTNHKVPDSLLTSPGISAQVIFFSVIAHSAFQLKLVNRVPASATSFSLSVSCRREPWERGCCVCCDG